MQLNADLSAPARVEAGTLAWSPSPAPGVERLRLERLGDEVARVTSVVRYAPGSRFPSHTHGGGEEILVLQGTLSDEHGDHHAGTYLRNPVGSSHAPHTASGCVLLVKLWWMHPDDGPIRLEPGPPDGWPPRPWGRRLELARTRHEETSLLHLAGALRLEVDHGGLELFVVEGTARLGGRALPRWTWLRRPGPEHLQLSAEGATIYCKQGHLRDPPAPPR